MNMRQARRARRWRRCSSLGACSTAGGTASSAPSPAAAAAGASRRSARTRRARARPRSTSTRACRDRAPNTEQTNTLVEQIKQTLDGQKIGNFTIKYTDLDDSSAANNGDWDGTVEQRERQQGRGRSRRDGLHRHVQLGRRQAVDPDPQRRPAS